MSQPRPPDRVDAALEKVAPLRYLEAHECARADRVFSHINPNLLSKSSFLSYIQCVLSSKEELNVFPTENQRYV